MIKSAIALSAPLALAALGFTLAVAPAEAQRRSPNCTPAEVSRLEAQAQRQSERSVRRNRLIPLGSQVDMPRSSNPACMEHAGSSMRVIAR